MKKMVFSLALLLGGAGATVAQSATDKVNHAVARDSKVNQMFVTTNSGDVKYYNTADLASVKFEGNKTIIAPKDGSDNDVYDASVREINFAKRVEQGENDNQQREGKGIGEYGDIPRGGQALDNGLTDADQERADDRPGNGADAAEQVHYVPSGLQSTG